MWLTWHDFQTLAWWAYRCWSRRDRETDQPAFLGTPDIFDPVSMDATSFLRIPSQDERKGECRYNWFAGDVHGTFVAPEPGVQMSPRPFQLVWNPLGRLSHFRSRLRRALIYHSMEDERDAMLTHLVHPRGFFKNLEEHLLERVTRHRLEDYLEMLECPWWTLMVTEWAPDPPLLEAILQMPGSSRLLRVKVVYQRTYDQRAPILEHDTIRWELATIPRSSWVANDHASFESHDHGWDLWHREDMPVGSSFLRFLLQSP